MFIEDKDTFMFTLSSHGRYKVKKYYLDLYSKCYIVICDNNSYYFCTSRFDTDICKYGIGKIGDNGALMKIFLFYSLTWKQEI